MTEAKSLNKKRRGGSRGQSLVQGAAILTFGTILVKVIGAIFKIPLGNVIGEAGMGYFSAAYALYLPVYTLSAAGFPSALARQVAENTAMGRYKDARKVHRVAQRVFLITGILGFIAMAAGGFVYINFVDRDSIYSVLAMSPSVFFCCMMASYRGYYEGQRNMFPTAVSEVIEAVVKLVLGAAFAYLIMYFGMAHYKETGNFLWFELRDINEAQNTILAFSVAGNICGISLASLCSSIFLILKYKIGGDGIPREYFESSITARRQKETLGIIIRTALPIVGGALVMSIGSLIDAVIIQNVLFGLAQNNADALFRQYHDYYPREVFYGFKDIPPTIHTSLWGCYGSSLTLMQLVTAVTQVFGSSAMPNVTSAWTKGDKAELKSSVDTVLKMTMMFTLPMAFGLCVLAHPIMGFIYASQDIVEVGGNVLTLMGITTIFTAIITPICSMLNGIGKVKLPMILYTICMLIKIGTSWVFVSIPEINIQGATAGSMISYAIICAAGMYLLIKHSKVVPDFLSTTVKPLIAAVCCAAAAYFANAFLEGKMNHRLSTILAILAAVIVYIAILLVLRTFSAKEVRFLPKGEKIAKTLEKLHLIG